MHQTLPGDLKAQATCEADTRGVWGIFYFGRMFNSREREFPGVLSWRIGQFEGKRLSGWVVPGSQERPRGRDPLSLRRAGIPFPGACLHLSKVLRYNVTTTVYKAPRHLTNILLPKDGMSNTHSHSIFGISDFIDSNSLYLT